MERSDVLRIMAVLRGAYPQFYRDISRQEAEATVNLWTDMFSGDDPALVAAAVKTLSASDEKGFPPHIGAVKAYLRRITEPKGLGELEAWNMVWPEVLKSWALMPPDTVQSVTASHFQRSYRAQRQSEKEYAMLPPDVKALADSLSGNMALEESNG